MDDLNAINKKVFYNESRINDKRTFVDDNHKLGDENQRANFWKKVWDKIGTIKQAGLK